MGYFIEPHNERPDPKTDQKAAADENLVIWFLLSVVALVVLASWLA